MRIENRIDWKSHVEEFLPKFSAACFFISSLIHTLNPDTLRKVYFVHFHSAHQYGIMLWGNSTHVHQVYK
jgi:hypothetical protein